MIDWEKGTIKDYRAASAIAKRAIETLGQGDMMSVEMDLVACHTHGCKLDWQKLAKFDDFNLLHDVCGINRHLDRETGKLLDCFHPRCAA